MNPKIIRISSEEVLKTYTATTRPANIALGQIVTCNHMGIDGKFRFSRNKLGTALSLGHLTKSMDHSTANFRSTSIVYASKGTNGGPTLVLDQAVVATTVTENEYDGMSGVLTVGTGINQFFTIIGNAPAVAATDKLKLYLAQPFATTPAATDDVQIMPWDHVIKTENILDVVSGVAQCAVADGEYFWRLVRGCGMVVIEDSTTCVGVTANAVFPATTDGEGIIGAAGHVPNVASAYGSITLLQKIGGAHTTGICMINTPFAD
jgi:hypothetical protein